MADIIDTNDFERAKGALAQALAVSGPILGALQQASLVFDVMQNAAVHRIALERDVADLMAQAEQAKSRRSDWDDMTAVSMQRAVGAENESKARIAEAAAAAETAIADLHDILSSQIAAAQAEATDTLQGIAKHVQDAKADHDAQMAALALDKGTLQAQVGELSAKLDSLKTNAARFAAALQG